MRLTTDPVFDAEPEFSPDGRKVAFTWFQGLGAQVYTVNVDGTGSTALTTATNGNGHPGWASGSTGSEPPEDCIPPPGNDLVQAFPPPTCGSSYTSPTNACSSSTSSRT